MTPKELNARLEAAAAALAGVERKRMPGGYALFVAGKIFANVTVEGRVGLKLPVAWCFEELAAMPGAGAWKLGQKTMEGWVLVPEIFHVTDAALREWVERAYACAIGNVPSRRPDVDPPPTTRSHAPLVPQPPAGRLKNGIAKNVLPSPQEGPAVIIDDDPLTYVTPPPPRSRSSRSLVTPPPSSRNGFDFSSYAPPPPSSVGIRVVPRDSKSPFEETLIGVPAPSSSNPELPPIPDFDETDEDEDEDEDEDDG